MEKVEIIRTPADFAKLEETWNAVLARSPGGNVFLTWEWVSNWVDVYLREGRLLTVVVYDGETPRAIAPLCVEEERFLGQLGLKTLRFIGSGEVCADHLDVMVTADSHAGVTRRIWEELFGPLRGEWDIFEYYDAPEDSPVLEMFRALAREDKRCPKSQLVGRSVCPYLPLPESWDAFLEGCSGSRRYTITYSMKKLSEQGSLEWRFCEKPGEVGPFMDAFISLHQKSWNERGKPGAFSSAVFAEFHRRLAKSLFDKGRLFLLSVHLDGRHVGSFYGFQYDGTLYYYLLGVETNPVKKVKTGTVVIGRCIEEAIRIGCREFDFLRGAEEYKYRWTSLDRRNPCVRFYNCTGRARAFLAGQVSYQAARKVGKGLLGRRAADLRRLLPR